MNDSLRFLLAIVAVAAQGACSGKESPRSTSGGGQGGMSGGTGMPSGGTGDLQLTADAAATSRLGAHIEQSGATVSVVSIACGTECVDVEAVGTGGITPYAFVWDDGSTSSRRRVCPASTSTFEVAVTDAGVSSSEFRRAPETVRVRFTAERLRCRDGGAGGAGGASGSSSGGATGSSNGGGVGVGGGSSAGGNSAGGAGGAGSSGASGTGDAGSGRLCIVGDPMGDSIQFFGNGAQVPRGRYRVSYTDGCMKYGATSGWTVDDFLRVSWNLVGDADPTGTYVPGQNYNWGALPGVSGLGYTTFDECVAASLLSPSVVLDLPGSKMGVIFQDLPRDDDVSGPNGRGPTWCLTRL